MTSLLCADELEKEIILMHQELTVKKTLLDECRQKLQEEISKHTETKSILAKHTNENKEIQMQLEFSFGATQKLEEENKRNREMLVKLQVQMEAYLNERKEFIDRSYNLGVENNELKNEVTNLKEQLKGHLAFQENYKTRQMETAKVVDEILSKQDVLMKEQHRLETICKEGLKFANKVSEEANFQAQFVQAANNSQRKMEEEMIRLMAALRELQDKNVKNMTEDNAPTYLDEWKIYEQNAKSRTEDLLEENKKLREELNFATTQIELLMKKY